MRSFLDSKQTTGSLISYGTSRCYIEQLIIVKTKGKEFLNVLVNMPISFAKRCANLSISDSLKALVWLPVSLLPIISKRASTNLAWNRWDNTNLLCCVVAGQRLDSSLCFANHISVCPPVPLIKCAIPRWFFLAHIHFFRGSSTTLVRESGKYCIYSI